MVIKSVGVIGSNDSRAIYEPVHLNHNYSHCLISNS